VVTLSVAVCLSVCLSVCNALTFESLDLERSFLVCRPSVSSGQVRISRSSGQGQGEMRKMCLCIMCSLVA